MEVEGLDWTRARNASKLQAVQHSVMKYRDLQKAENFSSSCVTLTFSRMILLHKYYSSSFLWKA
jgi:hypothetical protein